jgi:hypothetical protein
MKGKKGKHSQAATDSDEKQYRFCIDCGVKYARYLPGATFEYGGAWLSDDELGGGRGVICYGCHQFRRTYSEVEEKKRTCNHEPPFTPRLPSTSTPRLPPPLHNYLPPWLPPPPLHDYLPPRLLPRLPPRLPPRLSPFILSSFAGQKSFYRLISTRISPAFTINSLERVRCNSAGSYRLTSARNPFFSSIRRLSMSTDLCVSSGIPRT